MCFNLVHIILYEVFLLLLSNSYHLDAITFSGIFYGGADKNLDYADRPSFCLYSSGLSPPRDILIRFSRYQTI